MESMKMKAHVGTDGILKLEFPVDMSDIDLGVLIVMQPLEAALPVSPSLPNLTDRQEVNAKIAANCEIARKNGWPEGFFEQTYSLFADAPLRVDLKRNLRCVTKFYKYLLDTNACICSLNGRSVTLLKKLPTVPAEYFSVCSVVIAELSYSAKKSNKVAAKLASQQTFLSKFVSLPFDDPTVDIYADIRAQLEKAGAPIRPNYLLIAVITLAHGMILVAHNTKEFNRVPALRLEDWKL